MWILSWHQLAWHIFIGFSLSLQANVAVVFQKVHDHIHSGSLCNSLSLFDDGYRYWHSWMVTVVSFCVQYTVTLADWWVGSSACRQFTTVVENEVCAIYRWKMSILLDDEAVLWELYSFHINSKLDWTGTAYSPLWQRQIKTWCNWTCCWNIWQQKMRLQTDCHSRSDMSFVGQEPAQNGQAGCKALEK